MKRHVAALLVCGRPTASLAARSSPRDSRQESPPIARAMKLEAGKARQGKASRPALRHTSDPPVSRRGGSLLRPSAFR